MTGHQLFVYGMLRQGGGYSITDRWPQARFVGEASLNGDLYDLGQYPALVPGGTGDVIGEVYQIDENTLLQLDEFEAPAGYRRSEVTASVQGRPTMCWVYHPEPDRCAGARKIESGDWIDYLRGRYVNL